MAKRNNPNGANQYLVDPRQALFFSLYFDPKSDTFSNAKQSALTAGYELQYAENIMNLMPTWLSDRLEEMNTASMIRKAERNLDELLDLPSKTQAMGAFGPVIDKKTKKPIMVHNASLLKLKRETSEFVASRLSKKKYGDKGDGGVQLHVHVYSPEQIKRVAARVYNGESTSEREPDRLPDSDEPKV